MTAKTEQDYRRDCDCNDCSSLRNTLSILDDIANGPLEPLQAGRVNTARLALAYQVGSVYDPTTNRCT